MKNEKEFIGSFWSGSEVAKVHRSLCLDYNGRFSGSNDGQNAAEYIYRTLSSYGLDSVSKQSFEKVHWVRDAAQLEICSPIRKILPCLALPYSPSCDQEFDLIDLGMGHQSDIEKAGNAIAGSAVLIDDINPVEGPHLHRLQKYVSIKHAGAGSFMFVNKNEGMLAPTGTLAFNHQKPLDQALPSIGIAQEVGKELRYWCSKGPLRIHLKLKNTLKMGTDRNIIGDIKGTDSDDPQIIICAHYDGHDIAQGAFDNASGTAVVMEIARVLATVKESIPHNLRFILFGSEEMGLVGSHAYIKHNKRSLENLRFVINLDCVGAPTSLFIWLQDNNDWHRIFNQIIQQSGTDTTVENHLVPFSDHFPFFIHGIPGAFCCTPMPGGRGWGHTIADTFEKVSEEVLQKVSMKLGRIIFQLVSQKKLPQVSISSRKIKEILKERQLEEMMRYEGHWPFE